MIQVSTIRNNEKNKENRRNPEKLPKLSFSLNRDLPSETRNNNPLSTDTVSMRINRRELFEE